MNIFRNRKKDRIDEIKTQVLKNQKKSIRDLKKLNKAFRILLDEGSIEVTIKNVSGVLEELK